MHVGLVCEGDASASETVFSGTAKRMYLSLVSKGLQVHPVDASLQPLSKASAAALSFSPNRLKWRSKFRYGKTAAQFRTRAANRSLRNRRVDLVLQVGASFDPPRGLPYAIYSDWNMALDAVEARAANGSSRGLVTAELEKIGKDHARRYRGASMIFTISERLRKSFIDLYGISPDKVMTAYAGPNFDMEVIDKAIAQPKQNGPPTVLFIAKEFKRKGGDLVASAIKTVQEEIPDARLVYAGTEEKPPEFAALNNVVHLGLLNKENASDLQVLLSAYRQADLLVLPSRHDPFPTVIREAMFFGVPCIASDIWAMSEMIDDGRTGYLVAPESSTALAAGICHILKDKSRQQSMGHAGRARAEAMFSWEAVGDVLKTGIERVQRGA